MKKLNLNSNVFGKGEVLTRAQLKKVIGGDGSGSGGVPGGSESILQCTTRVYDTAKKACEADSVCNTLCDVTPFCHSSMLAAAAAACALN